MSAYGVRPSSSEDTAQLALQSVKNAWIECRSKTFSGRPYYFNKSTGEAAWSLTESEFEKVRKLEHINRSEGSIDFKESKMDPSRRRNYSPQHLPPQRVYNKQIVNNSFKQPFESFVGASFNQIVPPFPVNQVTSIGVPQFNAHSQGFNTNVWAVPPMHQIFIAPAVTPLTNQAHTSYITPDNLLSNVHVQNASTSQTSQPLSQRYCIRLNTQSQGRTRDYKIQRLKCNHLAKLGPKKSCAQRKTQKRVRFKDVPTDLRQILAQKRLLREQIRAEANIEDNEEFEIEYSEPDAQYSKTVSRPVGQCRQGVEDKYQSDVEGDDSDWLEENMSVQGTKLKLDVTNLRNLASPDTNPDCWYIVADQHIYLNHLTLLNILFDSADECHLMMPREVFSSLQAIVASGAESPRNVSRARRAIALFTQLLDAGMAVIGEDPAESDDRYVLNCCQNLLDQNYHVVLISNDPSLQGVKNDTAVPIFSIKEVKQILSSPPKIDSSEKELETPVLPIKITINNDLHHTDTKTTHLVDSGIQQIEVQELTTQNTHILSINIEENENIRKSSTSDACIQTDFIPLNMDVLGLPTPDTSQEHSDYDKNIQTDIIYPTFGNTRCDRSIESESSRCNSEKEIRLIRNSCNINETNTNVKKTQYKWRRRKDVKNPGTSDSKTIITDGNNVARLRKNFSNLSRSETTLSTNIDDDNISSETGSVRTSRNLVRNFTFEETSTSGVISNTSVDTEVERPLSALIMSQRSHSISNKCPTTRQVSNKSSSNMFEVRDENMENDLNTRSDEWVSRFVQIMEEVLSQMLQKEPLFRDDSMPPPPWSVREAAECIARKFQDELFVADVAHKLANVLDKISDEKGRIKADLTPPQFMEMYSYGVQLVEILQSIQDCEDLQTASELLATLLRDIMNPNMDASNNEPFNDNPETSENKHQVSMTSEAQEPYEDGNTGEMTSRQDTPQKLATEPKDIRDKIKQSHDFTSDSPYSDYHDFDSQSLLGSPSASVLGDPSAANSSPKIGSNFNVCPELEDNLKTSNPSSQQLTANLLDFKGFEDQDNVCPKFEDNLMKKPSPQQQPPSLPANLLDFKGFEDEDNICPEFEENVMKKPSPQPQPSPLSANVMDETLDYEALEEEDNVCPEFEENVMKTTSPPQPSSLTANNVHNDTSDFKGFEDKDNVYPDFKENLMKIPSPQPLLSSLTANNVHNNKIDKDNLQPQQQPSSPTADVMDDILDFEGFEYEEYLPRGFNCTDDNDNVVAVEHIQRLVSESKTSQNETADIFFCHIGKALLAVYAFCDKSLDKLTDRRITKQQLKDMNLQADEGYFVLLRLCNVLERILNRDPSELDPLSRETFRAVLSKCFDQASIQVECLIAIVNASQNICAITKD